MIIFYIFAMATVIFLSRYLFLEAKLPLRLGPSMQRFLSYSGPAVLTAIWAPIVFVHDGKMDLSMTNPYLLSAIVAALIAFKTKSVIATSVFSMAVFFVLKMYL